MKWVQTSVFFILPSLLFCAAKENNANHMSGLSSSNFFKGGSLRNPVSITIVNNSQQEPSANESPSYKETFSYPPQSYWSTTSRDEKTSSAHLGPLVLIYLLAPTVLLCCCLFALTHPRQFGPRNELQARVSIEMTSHRGTLNKSIARTQQEAVIVAAPDGTFEVGINVLESEKADTTVCQNEDSSTN